MRVLPRGLLFVALISFALTAVPYAYSQQGRDRVIEKAYQPNEPVELEDIQVRRSATAMESVKPGTRFRRDSEDWLKGLTVKLKNISGQAIIYAEVYIYLPTSASGDRPLRWSLRYGTLPTGEAETPSQPELPQGSSVTLVFSDAEYDQARAFLVEKSASVDFNTAKMRLGMVVFADGTAFKSGSTLRRDPNNPRKWSVIGKPNPSMALRIRSSAQGLLHSGFSSSGFLYPKRSKPPAP